MDPLLPRDKNKEATVLIESASGISFGDIKCSDKCSDDCCLLWLIVEMDKVLDGVVVFDVIKFKLGVDNNPLPLTVKAEERGAAAMASSDDRRPTCIIMSIA